MFRFYLRPDQTNYYALNGSGNVISTNIPTPIDKAPDGWEKTEIEWSRSKDFWGVFRSFTTPYQFVEDGAKILRYLYVNYGVEAQCFFEIQKQNDQTTIWEAYYSGEIDFSKFSSSAFMVNATIAEGGLKALLDAKDDTPFEIPVDPLDALTVYLDGIIVRTAHNYAPVAKTFLSNSLAQAMPPYVFYINEGDYPVGTEKSQDYYPAVPNPAVPDGYANYLFLAHADLVGEATLHQEFNITNPGTGAAQFTIYIYQYDKDGNFIGTVPGSIFYQTSIPAGTTTGNFFADATKNLTLSQGDRIFMWYGVTPAPPGAPGGSLEVLQFGNPDLAITNFLRLDFEFRFGPTTALAYRYYNVLYKLITKLTDSVYSADSDYLSDPNSFDLDNYPYRTVITPGDAIRRFTTPIPAIKITFKQLAKDFMYRWQMGVGIESDQIKVEPLSYFLDTATLIADLGTVSNLVVEPASQYLLNQLKIGYVDQDYDGLNGRDEFNTTHNYLLPLTSVKGEGDYASTLRADVYGIEYTRANLSGKTTTDNESDNDSFLIEIEQTAEPEGFHVARPAGFISGILFPSTKYNFGLTPKRNFFRIGGLIHFICHLLDLKTVTFQTSEKNQELESDFQGQFGTYIIEKADVLVSDLAAPIAKPIIFKFTAVPPLNIAALMATNPRGYFSFTWDKVQYKGYPMKVGTKPATYDSYEFDLLCTQDCDTSNLIT